LRKTVLRKTVSAFSAGGCRFLVPARGCQFFLPPRGCPFLGALIALVALALAGLFATDAQATTVFYQTDAQLVALSDRVLHGRVLDVRTELDPDTDTIYTVARLTVLEDLTGFTDSIIEVREPGGTLGATRLWIPGATTYTPGDQLVLCLKQRGGKWLSLAKSFSAFHVEFASSRGSLMLRRDVKNLDVIAAPVQGPDVRTLDEFRNIVSSVKGTQSVKPVPQADASAGSGSSNTSTPASASSTPVSAPFSLLGPLRWNKTDTGAAVLWYRNPSAPPPPGPPDFDAAITTATHVWSDPPESHITLTYSGTRSIGADTPYCAPSAPGVGVITFEDPTNEISFPVIAVGGGCGDGSSTLVNGTTFQGFASAFVVFAKAAQIDPSIKTPTNMLRVIAHEMGHGIGLGHTDAPGAPVVSNPQSNLMYSSCCYATQPIPPAIGPDDHNALVFVYPRPAGTPPPAGGFTPTPGDADGDGLPDWWEIQFGLDPHDPTGDNGASGDPDHDGFTNMQEFQNGTHPRGFVRRYLAEGVVNGFFDTQLAVLNPGNVAARVLVRLQPDTGSEKSSFILLAPHTRTTFTSAFLRTLLTGSFAILVESDQLVVVDRTVSWGGGYGSSSETAVESPSMTWYLAEGSTGGPFDVFYLLQNPSFAPVTALITYLRPGGATPLTKSYTVPARGRLTIWVNNQGFPDDATGAKLLVATDVSSVVQVTSGGPIIVERSMYLSRPEQPFAAGHDAAGVTQPRNHWFLAEGATGNFFDTYVLIENPNPAPTTVHATFLLTNGVPLTKDYVVPGNSRFTIFVNQEELPAGSGLLPLSAATFSTQLDVDATNPPIVVERAMWWPHGNWYEAHDVAGSAETGTLWAMAEGEQGGTFNTHTYVLIANVGSAAASVSIKAMLEDGTVIAPAPIMVPAKSRSTVEIADGPIFTGVNGNRFGVVVESLPVGSLPAQPIVIERSMYSDFAGQFWAAGTAALGACLQCTTTTTSTSH
jgi:hypothetical protein